MNSTQSGISPPPGENAKDIRCLLILLLFSLAYFHTLVLHPQEMIYSATSDLVGQTYGWKHLIRQTFLGGDGWLLWNPYLMCGYPALGNLNYALFFPLHALFLILPVGMASSWTYFLTFLLGAVAAYFFLRVIGVYSWGSLLGALAYGFGVRNAGHLVNGFVGHLGAVSLLPAAFAFATLVVRRRSWVFAGCLACTLAFILLSAFAQIFLYLMLILPLYFIWLLFNAKGKNDGKAQKGDGLVIFQFCSSLLLAVCLAAVHILPAMGLLGQLSRSGEMAPALYRLGSLPWRHYFTLLNPELLGRPGPEWCYFGSPYFWTLSFYTPIFLLPLASLSLVNSEGRVYRNFFLLLLPGIFLFSMGPNTPFYEFFHRLIPGVKLFREPGRMLFFYPLSLAVISGLGWNLLSRKLTEQERLQGRKYLMVLLILLLFLGTGYAFYLSGADQARHRSFQLSADFFMGGGDQAPLAVREYEKTWLRTIPLSTGVTVLLAGASFFLCLNALKKRSPYRRETWQKVALLLVAADLLFFSRGYLETRPPGELFDSGSPVAVFLAECSDTEEQPFRVADLAGILSDNLACVAGIEKVGGYDPINLATTQDYINLLNGRDRGGGPAWTLRLEEGFDRSMLDLLNVRYLLTRQPLEREAMTLVRILERVPVTLQNFGQVVFRRVYIYRNDQAYPRAWFVSRQRTVPEDANWAEQFSVTDPALTGILVDATGETVAADGPAPAFAEADTSDLSGQIAIQRLGPGKLRLEADCPGPGFIVLSQAYAHGWRAVQPGKDGVVKLQRADGMLSAFPIMEAGRKTYQVEYRPEMFGVGGLITLLAIVVAGGLLFTCRRRKGGDGYP